MLKKRVHLKFNLIKTVLPSVVILIFMISVVYQFQTQHQTQVEQMKTDLEFTINDTIEKREGRITTIANSIIGFYLGSQSVEREEFEAFSKKVLETNSDILNLFVIKDNLILQSYPNTQFTDKNIETIISNYPITTLNQKSMLIEYPITDNLTVVVAIRPNYFVSSELFLLDPLKIVIENPKNSDIIYQYESNILNSDYNKIILSKDEINTALIIEKQLTLNEFKTRETYELKYIISSNELVQNFTPLEMATILFGVSFSIAFFIVLFQSLSLQTQLQEKSIKLKESNESLEEALKMRNEFATMVSHELKTPVTPIKGFCKLLKDQRVGILNEKQLDYVNEIHNNADLLFNLIEDLLTVRKLDLDKMSFNQTEVASSYLLNKIQYTWKIIMDDKNIEFVMNNEKNMCVKGDEIRINQVFSNLIKNAIDFVAKDHGKIEIGAVDDGEFVKFYVKDNGIGISDENKSKVFQKFYQIDTSATRRHGGTGLGLSICKGLVEGMNGEIWFESKKDEGTVFFFKLPKCSK